ncbi:hypothetical protein HPB50_013134 [Hyalomma asiaticum]|uniref:Uncharacterized protein n=1 Tax=Hyalomma asiaticum TaxID=266040 RepID=A0ACB7SMJ9_HYAAI|nr:hypothetical protein HPB50_013134 [Hyalomma asiaticum]
MEELPQSFVPSTTSAKDTDTDGGVAGPAFDEPECSRDRSSALTGEPLHIRRDIRSRSSSIANDGRTEGEEPNNVCSSEPECPRDQSSAFAGNTRHRQRSIHRRRSSRRRRSCQLIVPAHRACLNYQSCRSTSNKSTCEAATNVPRRCKAFILLTGCLAFPIATTSCSTLESLQTCSARGLSTRRNLSIQKGPRRVRLAPPMAELPQSFVPSTTSGKDTDTDGRVAGPAFDEPESSRDRSSALTGEPLYTRRDIRSRSSSIANDGRTEGEEPNNVCSSDAECPRDQSSAFAGNTRHRQRSIHRRRSSRSVSSSYNNSDYCRPKNPYDMAPEQIAQYLCTPSVFVQASPQPPESFHWSIEELAEFFHASTDEEELTDPKPRATTLMRSWRSRCSTTFFRRRKSSPHHGSLHRK